MSSILLHTSNRLRSLANMLASVLGEGSRSALQPEIVVVPSLALRRWLTFELAQANRICANIAFPFLSDFISSLPEQVIAGSSLSRRFDAEQMLWRIHELLPSMQTRNEFAPVEVYLADADPLKLYQLSARIAALFDQYIVYRPDMVDAWERSREGLSGNEAWQAILWREITKDGAPGGGSDRSRTAVRKSAATLPERVFVFGVTEMPPTYLKLFFEAAADRAVHFFQLRPSREYYGDALTSKQRIRRKIDSPELVNPLLASLGGTSSHFTDLLLETDERFGHSVKETAEVFVEPAAKNLLSTLQRDVVSAVNRGAPSEINADEKIVVHPNDRSLVIHSCYSAMREVEVLYDQLLALFESDPTLRPRDILVMAPEIEKYSPLVHAVFAYPEKSDRKIPYSVSDRHPRSESVVFDTFLTLLELATSRCTAEQVYGIISSELVAARFGLSAVDLALIHIWIREVGIRWGIDAQHREQMGLPAVEANTWRFGLDRLLLGYAMRAENRKLFDGILPYDDIEGDRGDLLGRFISGVENIVEFVSELQIARPLSQWATVLRNGVDRLLETEDEEYVRDLRFLRKTISRLETVTGDPKVGITVLRCHLEQLFGAMQQRGGFLKGGVTFCALKPGRSIPARVICLLGMNDDVFPRRPQLAQFDLMAERQLGDPSPREDDRYAFLETICAAGEHLHLSYVGRSIVHNQPIPPSVVVSELLDYLQQAFAFPTGTCARAFLTVHHPLQAFSARYFSSERADHHLFSYSEANAAAAAASARLVQSAVPRPFLTTPLPPPDDAQLTVALPQLVSFLSAPARFFLKEHFGVDLREFDAALSEDEPLELDALEEYYIRQELLAQWVDAGQPDLKVFAARGITAPGEMGQLQLRSLDRETANFRKTVIRYLGDGRKDEPISVDLRVGKVSLTGHIESVYGGKIVHYRCANLKLRDWLQAWVDHLARCAVTPHEDRETILVGRDRVVSWQPVAKPEEQLHELCQLYLDAARQPIAFFPVSGFEYVKAEHSGKKASSAALQAWDGYGVVKERDDGAIQLLFDKADPLSDEAIDIARKVFAPLIKHSREEELE